MRIPPAYVSAGPATSAASLPVYHTLFWTPDKNGSYTENWSSLIGIVTAITGNVLISFALNTQRYAHIRLDREWQEKERLRKQRVASSASISRLAEEVAKNRNGGHHNFTPRDSQDSGRLRNGRRDSEDGFDASESDPLVPRSPPLSARPSQAGEDSLARQQEDAIKQKSYLKSPYWWLGIILMTIGEAGNFLAYGFAPASIVSPLGVVALISNCIIAPFMLKERFRKRDAIGVVIAVGGAVTVVLSANDSNPKLGPDEIWDLIRRWEFETYLGITVGVIALLMVASNKYGDKNILIDLGLVGLFGGYTALSTKGVSSLLSYTLWRVITFPVFYLLVAILIGTAIMQIKYVNRALQRFDATQVIPVQFVLFTLSVIGGSAVLYRDFERTSAEDAGKFVGGCSLTFFGVWLITSGRPKHHEDDEEDREPEAEDAINLIGERYIDVPDLDVDTLNGAANSARASSRPRPASSDKRYSGYNDDDSPPTTPSRLADPATATARPQTDRSSTADMLQSLTGNPWMQEGGLDVRRTPPLNRHTSTPVLPSEAAPPPLASASNPELAEPRTPPRGKSYNEAPMTPGSQLRRLKTGERVGSVNRNSVAGPLLASPLSTTLSAMVQDLKRGGNIRQREVDGSVRRRGSVLGIGADELDNASFGDPLSRRQTQASAAPSEQTPLTPSSRGRSLSGTLNDLWRGIRGSSSRENMQSEETRQNSFVDGQPQRCR